MLGRELEVPLDAITEATPDAPLLKTDYVQAYFLTPAIFKATSKLFGLLG